MQEQYFSSLPFETLRFDDIRKSCTDWPDTVLDYGCGTVYQNLEIRPASQIQDQRIQLDHLEPQAEPHQYDTSVTRRFTDRTPIHDLDMSGIPEHDGLHLRISVAASPQVLAVDEIEDILNRLCAEVQALNEALQQPIPSSISVENRIYILGVGNLGKFVAHALRRQHPSLPITLLFHRNELLSKWDEAGRTIGCIMDGVFLETKGFDVELLSMSTQDGAQMLNSPIKHLIVATKTYTTASAISLVKHRLESTSNILFLQNGKGRTTYNYYINAKHLAD
jgi:hypothetical protein